MTDEKRPTVCEGSCAEHTGALKRVHVHHPNHDWGEFTYCDEAIEEDKRRGLSVEVLSNE